MWKFSGWIYQAINDGKRKLWLPELLPPDVFMEVMEEERKEKQNGKI